MYEAPEIGIRIRLIGPLSMVKRECNDLMITHDSVSIALSAVLINLENLWEEECNEQQVRTYKKLLNGPLRILLNNRIVNKNDDAELKNGDEVILLSFSHGG